MKMRPLFFRVSFIMHFCCAVAAVRLTNKSPRNRKMIRGAMSASKGRPLVTLFDLGWPILAEQDSSPALCVHLLLSDPDLCG